MIKEGTNHHKKIRKGVTIQKIDGVATSIKLETYVDLTIEKTIQSVKRADYSQYTPITDYYY